MEFDPYSTEFFEDPWEVYRWLRDEAPIYQPAPAPGIYRGHVFVTNLPGEYLSVEIEVVQPVGVDQEQRWRQRAS